MINSARLGLIGFLCIFLSACAMNAPLSMQMIQRDNSKTYQASWLDHRFNQAGTILMAIGDKVYKGKPSKVDEGSLFGLRSRYGNGSAVVSGTSFLNTYYKAILVDEDGVGMRCDIVLSMSGGSGICVDAKQKVYELVISQ
jgi:hypothetical protein